MASDGTPDKLVFLHGSSFFSRDHETGEVRKTQLTGPFAGGYMLAVGQWVNKTNINGTLIPTDFLFTGFGPKYNAANSNDLSRIFSFRCVITNIAFTDIPRIPQILPTNAHVTDRRFTQMGYSYVRYVVTNGLWPSLENSYIQQLLVHAPRFTEEDEALAELGIRQIGDMASPNQKKQRQEKAKWLFLIILFFPSIYFCARILQAQKHNKNKWQ